MHLSIVARPSIYWPTHCTHYGNCCGAGDRGNAELTLLSTELSAPPARRHADTACGSRALQVVQADPRADLVSTIDIGSWANVHPVGYLPESWHHFAHNITDNPPDTVNMRHQPQYHYEPLMVTTCDSFLTICHRKTRWRLQGG
jgi:hypothetical protein